MFADVAREAGVCPAHFAEHRARLGIAFAARAADGFNATGGVEFTETWA
jgi:hypothetical protein